jgi:hypothetical protein
MKRALLTGLAPLLCPALVLAQTPPGAADPAHAGVDPTVPAGVHLVDDAEPKTPFVPRAPDLLGSHVLIGAALGPAWSLGKLGSSEAAVRGFGTGLGFRADAGFGLSRSVAVGVWGTFATYADGDRCGSSCSGQAFAIGPFVRYHLAQGLRFDPWLTLGSGYRQLSYTGEQNAKQKFSGLEWLHFELGADYYLFSGFGLGPYGALGLSSYSKRPSSAGDVGVNTELSVGLRFLLDLPGR